MAPSLSGTICEPFPQKRVSFFLTRNFSIGINPNTLLLNTIVMNYLFIALFIMALSPLYATSPRNAAMHHHCKGTAQTGTIVMEDDVYLVVSINYINIPVIL